MRMTNDPLFLPHMDHVIFSCHHTVVVVLCVFFFLFALALSVFKVAKVIASSINVLSNYFKTRVDNCQHRYVCKMLVRNDLCLLDKASGTSPTTMAK